MVASRRYWLMKTEPDVFSYDDLVKAKNSTEGWDGVRNYQARNFMRDDFKLGDQIFIYHSSTAIPAIVGIAEVVREAYPDLTALDPKSKYFDEKSAKLGESRWVKVDVRAKERFANPVTLQSIRENPSLEGMLVIQRGQRLSIQSVNQDHWKVIAKLGRG